jgi:3-oxoadipate enol-lactonase
LSYADLGENRLYYEESGAGTPLIFLHGFSLDHRMWQPQAVLLERKYLVICPDALGHGRSDCPKTGYGRADRVEDLAKFVDSLKIGRFHLVGLSMGGSTAIGFALKYQERLISLTLASTGAAGYSVSRKFERLDQVARQDGVKLARQKWLDWSLAWYKDANQDVGRLIRMMMEDYTGAVWADPMRGRYPKEQDLGQVHEITVPTLILAGELDRVFATLARGIHHQIEGSLLKVYEQAGHMLNLEAPDRFNGDLEAFLQEAGQV